MRLGISHDGGPEYGGKFTGLRTVVVDRIRYCHSASGVMLRVVGVWKRPRWLDLLWFDIPDIQDGNSNYSLPTKKGKKR